MNETPRAGKTPNKDITDIEEVGQEPQSAREEQLPVLPKNYPRLL